MSYSRNDNCRDIRIGGVQSYAVAILATETIAGPVDGRESVMEGDQC